MNTVYLRSQNLSTKEQLLQEGWIQIKLPLNLYSDLKVRNDMDWSALALPMSGLTSTWR